MNEVGVTDNSAISAFKEIIAGLQQQLAASNAKLDGLQTTVDACRDSVSALKTTIVESTNYWTILTSPYGVAIIAILSAVICYIAIKKGITVSRGDTSVSLGKSKEDK